MYANPLNLLYHPGTGDVVDLSIIGNVITTTRDAYVEVLRTIVKDKTVVASWPVSLEPFIEHFLERGYRHLIETPQETDKLH